MQPADDELLELVELLARTDATCWPFRLHGSASYDAYAAVRERIESLHASGLPIGASGENAAGRKQRERRLDDLCKTGFLVAYVRGGRRIGFRLPIEAQEHLRWRALVKPTARESWPLLKRLASVPDSQRNGGHVAETTLAGCDYRDKKAGGRLWELERDITPLLAVGLVSWASDFAGRIGYALTDAGRRTMRKKPPPPPMLPKFAGAERVLGDRLHEAYLATFDAVQAERATWQRQRREVVPIPLGAGSWPRSKRGRNAAHG